MKKDFNYSRRTTWEVNIGNVPMGAEHPIRVQSMNSTSTDDIEASVAQAKRIADAGACYVRLTTQGVKEAENLGRIRAQMHADGYTTPLVADIHFNPKAAFKAAEVTDKVRINPGNFVDPGRTFIKLTYTDEEYAKEIEKISNTLIPFIQVCREHGTAVRIGVNHGSLSDRIMSRYGDTPAGMVESAMEFLRVFVAEKFYDVVISIKASNTVIMVETVRRLVQAMDAEDMHFPLHLGVTEAGDGEDGRIKSAVGIGTLLSEGIGDTIRVSLSEEPELEIPVANKLVEYTESLAKAAKIEGTASEKHNYIMPERRATKAVGIVGGKNLPIVIGDLYNGAALAKKKADFYYCKDGKLPVFKGNFIVPLENYKEDMPEFVSVLGDVEHLAELKAVKAMKWLFVDAQKAFNFDILRENPEMIVMLSTSNANISGSLQAFMHRMLDEGVENPVVFAVRYEDSDVEWLQVKAGMDFGSVLMNGFGNGIWLAAPNFDNQEDVIRWQFGILQAARLRSTKTEFISCPSCGRTLFDLQTTVKKIKAATSHLSHLKIGIMGCIVNGPGEMADADYGYVGAGPNRISLYKNKQCIERNIPQEEAIPHLIELIKANGDWVDAPAEE